MGGNMGGNIFTTEQVIKIEKIKKQMTDKEQIILQCNKEQKIKLFKLGKKVYQITFNFGDKKFDDCVINMYLAKNTIENNTKLS